MSEVKEFAELRKVFVAVNAVIPGGDNEVEKYTSVQEYFQMSREDATPKRLKQFELELVKLSQHEDFKEELATLKNMERLEEPMDERIKNVCEWKNHGLSTPNVASRRFPCSALNSKSVEMPKFGKFQVRNCAPP